jgi:hypothetical protein
MAICICMSIHLEFVMISWVASERNEFFSSYGFGDHPVSGRSHRSLPGKRWSSMLGNWAAETFCWPQLGMKGISRLMMMMFQAAAADDDDESYCCNYCWFTGHSMSDTRNSTSNRKRRKNKHEDHRSPETIRDHQRPSETIKDHTQITVLVIIIMFSYIINLYIYDIWISTWKICK